MRAIKKVFEKSIDLKMLGFSIINTLGAALLMLIGTLIAGGIIYASTLFLPLPTPADFLIPVLIYLAVAFGLVVFYYFVFAFSVASAVSAAMQLYETGFISFRDSFLSGWKRMPRFFVGSVLFGLVFKLIPFASAAIVFALFFLLEPMNSFIPFFGAFFSLAVLLIAFYVFLLFLPYISVWIALATKEKKIMAVFKKAWEFSAKNYSMNLGLLASSVVLSCIIWFFMLAAFLIINGLVLFFIAPDFSMLIGLNIADPVPALTGALTQLGPNAVLSGVLALFFCIVAVAWQKSVFSLAIAAIYSYNARPEKPAEDQESSEKKPELKQENVLEELKLPAEKKPEFSEKKEQEKKKKPEKKEEKKQNKEKQDKDKEKKKGQKKQEKKKKEKKDLKKPKEKKVDEKVSENLAEDFDLNEDLL